MREEPLPPFLQAGAQSLSLSRQRLACRAVAGDRQNMRFYWEFVFAADQKAGFLS